MNKEALEGRRIEISSRRVSGVSWRLFGTLIIFVSLVLTVIWLFQIALLNSFYENSKLDGFNDTNDMISVCLDDSEELKKTVIARSLDTDSCIRVFRIDNKIAVEVADSDVRYGCFLHHLSSDALLQLYEKAEENGGVFIRKLSNPNVESNSLNSIHVEVMQGGDGYKYVVMQDSELIPLQATVDTLERQFGWIMCILIMGAFALSLSLSRLICTPMERMSRSAKRLAKGDYGAHFEGGGYREAEELADALNYAAEELQKNDSLQKELVANISHDLRTPLTMIKGYSEVMRDIPEENTPENVQIIIDEAERLTELVNDMLDLSKIRAGTRKPELEMFDLTESVRAVLGRYEKFTESQSYVVLFEGGENVSVMADRTMILQVVYNLVNNALNYTGEDKTVRITQSVKNGKVRISVTDSGEGIAKEDIPYIWDRYYKVDKVHKRAVVGTGLGLSIVKGILESHGATYGVESVVGEGSTFYFELDVVYDGDFEPKKR